AGVTVLDFGQVYQGPYASLLMAQAGADVIKVEPPQGEPLRRRAPPGKSTTFPIAMLNSSKRAIILNLKHARGRELLFRMAGKGRPRRCRFHLRHSSLRRGRDGVVRTRADRQGTACRGRDARGGLSDLDVANTGVFRDRQAAAAPGQCEPWPRAARRLSGKG